MMKILKMFLSIKALFLGNIGIAQSPTTIKHATSKVKMLNDRITAINPNVPLNLAYQMNKEKLKAYNRDIKTTVLSKAQVTTKKYTLLIL